VAELGPRIGSLVDARATRSRSEQPPPVLLAVDQFLVQTGLSEVVVSALREAGLESVVVSDFGPELVAEQIDAATEIARTAGCVAVVGVGGGTVLDAAKMIALLLTNAATVRDHLGQLAPAVHRVPLALIPTTVGTGAEVTRISMVSVDGSKKIIAAEVLIPDLAILDPIFVENLPPQVVGATGMDALAHAVESIMSLSSTPLTEAAAYAAIDILGEHLAAAYDGNVEARGHLLVAANLAGLALNAGVVLGHSLAYSAARLAPLSHGASAALALPYTIAYNGALSTGTAVRLAGALTNGRSGRLRDAADAVRELSQRVGQPTTLTEAGIPVGGETEMARTCVEEYPRPTNPERITLVRVAVLVEAMRSGDLAAAFAVTQTETNGNA
jgi:alcohol dehydrogenase class IV